MEAEGRLFGGVCHVGGRSPPTAMLGCVGGGSPPTERQSLELLIIAKSGTPSTSDAFDSISRHSLSDNFEADMRMNHFRTNFEKRFGMLAPWNCVRARGEATSRKWEYECYCRCVSLTIVVSTMNALFIS